MRKVREVLRLKWACGLGDRAVAASCSLSRSTVSKYVRRAKEAGAVVAAAVGDDG